MNERAKIKLADAGKMLAEAAPLSASKKHGEALTCAYKASEGIAAAYLLGTLGRIYPDSDEAYELFNKEVRTPERPEFLLQEIGEVVGDVTVLRETYIPALLDETTAEDAGLMIDRVSKLHELVEKLLGFCGH